MRTYSLYIALAMVLALSACGRGKGTAELPGESEVLAKVDGSAITRFELNDSLERMLGEYQSSLLDDGGRKQALQSLVISRAMSQAAQKELGNEEKARIEKQTEAYREKLLTNAYLKAHAKIEPVNDQMVRDFYDKNPDRFGGKSVRRYDLLVGMQKLDGVSRDKAIKALAEANTSKDWKDLANKLTKQNLPIQFRQGNMDDQLLLPQLRTAMQSLKVGGISDVVLIDGKPHAVRIVGEEKIPPRPLNEVSDEIRKALAPVQMKKAVKEVSDEVLKTIKVKYTAESAGKS